MKYHKVDEGLFPQALSALNGLRKCADVSGMPSNSIRTNPLMLLMAAVMYVSVILVLFAPRPAEAMSSYVPAVVSNNYPGSNLANLCANCHTDWAGGGPYNAWGTDYNLYTTTGGVTPLPNNLLYTYDQDNDGSSSHTEFTNSQSTGRPPLPNRWFPAYPDKDGDGCILIFNRFGDSGAMDTPLSVTSAGYVGASTGFIRYGPQGWDVDDNDATQGCSTAWPTTPNPGTFVNPGTTTDVTPPAAITNFRANGLLSAAIPLVWTATGDDGLTGTAHNYDLKYTTAAAASSSLTCGGGTVACNVRSPADWASMYDMKDTVSANGFAIWNTGTAATPLMRAYYEPIPSAPGTVQACNAIGQNCTASPGASYILTTKGGGTQPSTNVIVNGTTYWLAVRASDGVAKPGGTINAPGTITENLSLSNIIAVTAGTAGTTATSGAAISSISPTMLTGPTSPATITVTGFGLNSTQSAQMVLTNSAGTTIAVATGLSYSATAVAGSFASPIPDGVYNLELRTAGAVTKAAWVNAVTVSGFAVGFPVPTVTAVTPNSRGQGATNQNVTITGTNFTGATSVAFGAGVTVNTFIVNSSTQITANITVAATATLGARSVTVTNAAGTNAANALFSVVVAPTLTCSPPNGTYGVAYSHVCIASGGTPPYTWTAIGLPPGLNASVSADTTTLTIAGTPNVVGTYVGSVSVSDSNAGMASVGISITISLVASDVDLVMTAVSTSTTSVTTGTMFVIDSTEANIGTTDMTVANNIVSFYLSLDNVVTTSDIELVASRTVTALPAGASSAGSTSTFARASTPSGTYYLGACADVSNLQLETNETNNCLASAATITIIGSITVPGAPTIGTATAGNASASVTFTAPANNGGSAITGYTATSSPGGITGTCTASPCTVNGLTNGVAYTFTVTATNAMGTGPASAASNSVTPQENVPPSVPTKLTATAFSTTQINLTWRASTDNVGVTGYKVYRNGVQVGTPSGTSFNDTGLTAATSYKYTVAACDAAGNCSAQSATVTGATKRK